MIKFLEKIIKNILPFNKKKQNTDIFIERVNEALRTQKNSG